MRFISKKPQPEKRPAGEIAADKVSADLQANTDKLKILLQGCSDAIIKEFKIGHDNPVQGLILCFDGLVDKIQIEQNILKPLCWKWKW
jgi:hypothetical protein